MPKLTHFSLCPFSRSIRLLLAELKMEVELADERPWEWSKELLALNPSGDLPVLETDEGLRICGAYAISEYLADSARDGATEARRTPIFPGPLEGRAEVRRLVDWFHRKCHAEVTLPLLEEKVYRRFDTRDPQWPDSDVVRAARSNVRYHISYIDHLMPERSWLGGKDLSFADFAAAGHISTIDYLGEIGWAKQSPAKLWYARLKSRPSLRALLAERTAGVQSPPSHYADPDF